MDRIGTCIIAVCLLFLIFSVYGCTQSIKQHREFREACEAKGGVPFQPRYGQVCLKKEQVIPL